MAGLGWAWLEAGGMAGLDWAWLEAGEGWIGLGMARIFCATIRDKISQPSIFFVNYKWAQ